MKKSKTIFALLFACFSAATYNANAQQLHYKTPLSTDQAVNMAKEQLTATLELIEPTELKNFGFATDDDFSKIEFGSPIYIAALPTEKPRDYSTLDLTIQSIQMPLLINGAAKCFMYISEEEGSWKVVGIGGANYATQHPSVFNQTVNENYGGRILINAPHIQQEYLVAADNTYMPLLTMAENVSRENINTASLIEKYYAPVVDLEQSKETPNSNK